MTTTSTSPLKGARNQRLAYRADGVYDTHHEQRRLIKRLQAEGWTLHHVKGSHHQFKHPRRPDKITVPHPRKDLPTGRLRSIFRQAGWERR